MISLFVGIGFLVVLALAFVFWPLIKSAKYNNHLSSNDLADRLSENVRLFHEHISELESQLQSGRLDQLQFEQLKLEHERALLADEVSIERAQKASVLKIGAKSFIVFGVLLVIASLWLYSGIGSRADVALQQAIAQKQEQDYQDALQNRDADPKRARELIRLVEGRLGQKPDNLQYWFLLARTSMEINDFSRAANAYQKALDLDKESPLVMAELAQAIFLRDGNQMSPAVNDLAEAALEKDPQNTMALGLAGIGAFSKKDYPNAIKYWQRVVSILGADSPGAESLEAGIDKAMTLYAANGGDSSSLQQAIDGRHISLSVDLAKGINATPDQYVYVYARAWQGAKMPLAIKRIKVSELPAQVTLTEAMAMSPALSLAQAQQVELVARVSQDGTANAKTGDWQGSIGPIDMQAIPADLLVTIDRQITE